MYNLSSQGSDKGESLSYKESLHYRWVTISGNAACPGDPFSVGTETPLISQTISLSDGAKENFGSRIDNITSAKLVVNISSARNIGQLRTHLKQGEFESTFKA